MVKQLSIGSITVFDHRSKNQHHYSKLKPSKTQFSFTVKRDDQENMEKKRIIAKNEMDRYLSCKKKVAQQLKSIQESRLITKTKKSGVGSNNLDSDNVFLESYPFVEVPVKFQFGDHEYGNQLFLDLHKEILHQSVNKAASHNGGQNKYSGDDIYSLSTQAGLMDSFVEDNLF